MPFQTDPLPPTGWLIYTNQRIDPYYWHGATFTGDEWNGYPIKRKAPVYEGALGVTPTPQEKQDN